MYCFLISTVNADTQAYPRGGGLMELQIPLKFKENIMRNYECL